MFSSGNLCLLPASAIIHSLGWFWLCFPFQRSRKMCQEEAGMNMRWKWDPGCLESNKGRDSKRWRHSKFLRRWAPFLETEYLKKGSLRMRYLSLKLKVTWCLQRIFWPHLIPTPTYHLHSLQAQHTYSPAPLSEVAKPLLCLVNADFLGKFHENSFLLSSFEGRTSDDKELAEVLTLHWPALSILEGIHLHLLPLTPWIRGRSVHRR